MLVDPISESADLGAVGSFAVASKKKLDLQHLAAKTCLQIILD
jgi:hypothetical protein